MIRCTCTCTGYMYRYEITAANRVALTNFKACDNSGTVDPSRASSRPARYIDLPTSVPPVDRILTFSGLAHVPSCMELQIKGPIPGLDFS